MYTVCGKAVGQILVFLLVVPTESKHTTSNVGVPIEKRRCTISLFPLHFSPLWLQIKFKKLLSACG